MLHKLTIYYKDLTSERRSVYCTVFFHCMNSQWNVETIF